MSGDTTMTWRFGHDSGVEWTEVHDRHNNGDALRVFSLSSASTYCQLLGDSTSGLGFGLLRRGDV